MMRWLSLCAAVSKLRLRGLQAGEACQRSPRCFFYQIENRSAAAQQLAAWPGTAATIKELGYSSLRKFRMDMEKYMEPMYLLSQFCITPPGAARTPHQHSAPKIQGRMSVVFCHGGNVC